MTPVLEKHLTELTQGLLSARMSAKDGEFGLLKDSLAELVRTAVKTYQIAEKLHRQQLEQ